MCKGLTQPLLHKRGFCETWYKPIHQLQAKRGMLRHSNIPSTGTEHCLIRTHWSMRYNRWVVVP